MKQKLLPILLGLAAAAYAVPVVITVAGSFQYDGSIFTLRQFGELLITNNTVLRHFWLSAGYASVITVFCVAISFPLGFFFAKARFWGRDALFFAYILVMMLPFQATLLPNYIQLRDFDLLGSPMAIVLPMIFSPFAVFLFRQFIKGIPDDLLEYTLLETSSAGKLLWYIVVPQVKAAAVALAVLIFCECWNIVEQALLFLSDNQSIMPLSVMLSRLPEDVAFAGATMYMVPVIAIFFLFRESLQTSMEKYRW
jgi:multiple sugar transport system permease protein